MELKTKIVEVGWFRIFWVLFGMTMFLKGVIEHDWLLLVAGFLWNFQDIDIIHWNGKEYK